MTTRTATRQKRTQFPNVNTREINTIVECMNTCRACAKQCFEEGNTDTAFECAHCAQVCDLAVKFKSWDSRYTSQVLDLCEQICRDCAETCEQEESAACQECAEACQSCANACSTYATSYR